MEITRKILPDFDFSAMTGLERNEIISRCLSRFRAHVQQIQEHFPEPMLPEPGGSELEIDELETTVGVPLPEVYREFLRRVRYVVLDDVVSIAGLEYNGVSIGEDLWVSDEHHTQQEVLVFGAYWRYADGDQLVIPLGIDDPPVVAYLHEHGPLFEYFAPSFLGALWRLAFEGPAA